MKDSVMKRFLGFLISLTLLANLFLPSAVVYAHNDCYDNYGSTVTFYDNSNTGRGIKTAKIGSDKFVAVWAVRESPTGDYEVLAKVGSISGTTISWGSAVVIEDRLAVSGYSATFGVAALDTDKFVVAYSTWDHSCNLYGRVCTVSGTTITAQAEYELNSGDSETIDCCQLTTDEFAVIYNDESSRDDLYAAYCSVSGNVITVEDEDRIDSSIPKFTSCCRVDDDHFVAAYVDSGNSDYATFSCYDVSSGSLVQGSAFVAVSEATGWVTVQYLVDNGFVALVENSAGGVDFGLYSVSGTTISCDESLWEVENDTSNAGYTNVAVNGEASTVDGAAGSIYWVVTDGGYGNRVELHSIPFFGTPGSLNTDIYSPCIEYTSIDTDTCTDVSVVSATGSNSSKDDIVVFWRDGGDSDRFKAKLHQKLLSDAPVVSVQAATDVDSDSATANGNIEDIGAGSVTSRGFVYDTVSRGAPDESTSPADSDYAYYTTESGTFGTGAYTASLTGLSAGETYYIRAWAHNSEGYGYSSSEQSFITKPEGPSSFAVSDCDQHSIAISWTKGSGAETTKVLRKTGSYPANSSDGTVVYSGNSTSFRDGTGDNEHLTTGTTYYYRAWSIADDGSTESDDYGSASQIVPDFPTVVTVGETDVGETSATLQGNITALGGENVEERGFYYSTKDPYERISPDGAIDNSTYWTYSEGGGGSEVYDNNFTTYIKQEAADVGHWQEFTFSSDLDVVGFTIAAVEYDTSDSSEYVSYVDLDLYYSSSWHSIVSNRVLNEKYSTSVMFGTVYSGVSKVRVKPHVISHSEFYLYEFDVIGCLSSDSDSNRGLAIIEVNFCMQGNGSDEWKAFHGTDTTNRGDYLTCTSTGTVVWPRHFVSEMKTFLGGAVELDIVGCRVYATDTTTDGGTHQGASIKIEAGTTVARDVVYNSTVGDWLDGEYTDVYFGMDYNVGHPVGDVSLDGKVNIIDSMFVSQYIEGTREFDAYQYLLGDVDEDGDCDSDDADYISSYTSNPDSYPLPEDPLDPFMGYERYTDLAISVNSITNDEVRIYAIEFIVMDRDLIKSSHDSGSYGTGSFSKSLTGLDEGVDYFYLAYAEHDLVGYGSAEDFTTLSYDLNVSPDSYDAGIQALSSTVETGLDYFTITNDSNCVVDVTIGGSDFVGEGTNWTLSDTATPGSNIAGLKAGLEGGSYTIVVKKTLPYNILVEDLSIGGTQNFGLRLYMPTEVTDANKKSCTVTLTIVES